MLVGKMAVKMNKKKFNEGWFYILKATDVEFEDGQPIYYDGWTKKDIKKRQYFFNSKFKTKSEFIFSKKVKNPSQVHCDFKYKWHWNYHKEDTSEQAMILVAQKICDSINKINTFKKRKGLKV